MKEKWKVIKTDRRYKISTLGRVLSRERLVWCGDSGGTKLVKERILKQCKDNNGYWGVFGRGKDGKRVHRLVAEAFIPNPENKPHVNHINGIPSDNRVENLEWVTHRENILHAVKIGTMKNKGEKNGRALITNEQAEEIISRYKVENISYEKLGKEYGVSSGAIRHVVIGDKAWKWLKR